MLKINILNLSQEKLIQISKSDYYIYILFVICTVWVKIKITIFLDIHVKVQCAVQVSLYSL